MSMDRRGISGIGKETRNRKPERCRAERIASSRGLFFPGVARIRAEPAGVGSGTSVGLRGRFNFTFRFHLPHLHSG
jgi:hypothetical protein